ncbi:MAG: HlyC/CorC family transporter [Desulfuromonadaceae bacterium]|nr:HlyC/CorC family transporter [Desulfuromonadaceae bacterium]
MSDSEPEPKNSPKSSFWNALFGGRKKSVSSEEELQELIHASANQGVINAEEGEMFSSIIEFGETIVREEMIPRTEMHCCSVDASLQEMIDVIIRYGHSRIPVYEGSVDHIVGLVYAKDLLRFWGKSDEEMSLRELMRTPYFVPETKRIEELLREFRSKRVHLAIAIDEYGGTSGLITLEDLIEEIVGDIKDEYDIDDNLLVEDTDGSVIVDARLNLYELEDYYDLPEIPRNQFDSVGGLLLHVLGHVPKIGEEVAYADLRFTILDSDERAIHQVRICRIGSQDQGEGVESEAGESSL